MFLAGVGVGMFVGALIGVFAIALCVAGKLGDK